MIMEEGFLWYSLKTSSSVNSLVFFPPEWDSLHHRQEEAHLQAVPGRVHCSGEDRERLHALRACAAGVCAWRQPTGTTFILRAHPW